MTDGAVITFASLELESDDLLILVLFDDFSFHTGSGNKRETKVDLIATNDEEDITESGFFAGFGIELLDTQNISFGDAVLFAAGLDDCVGHGKSLEKGVRGCHRSFQETTEILKSTQEIVQRLLDGTSGRRVSWGLFLLFSLCSAAEISSPTPLNRGIEIRDSDFSAFPQVHQKE
jgi:hypothetical protein